MRGIACASVTGSGAVQGAQDATAIGQGIRSGRFAVAAYTIIHTGRAHALSWLYKAMPVLGFQSLVWLEPGQPGLRKERSKTMAKSNPQNPLNDEVTTLSDDRDQFARLTAALNAPAEFERRGGDLVGFWDPDLTPIHCIPKHVKLFDGNIDKDKPSILLTVQLTKPCGVRPPKDNEDEDAPPFAAPPGSLVGVWYKPGMRAIRDLCNVEVWMKQDGEKDTGKPQPMKLFDVRSSVTGTRIPVSDDTRDKSKPVFKDGKWYRTTDFDTVRHSVTRGNGMSEEEANALIT